MYFAFRFGMHSVSLLASVPISLFLLGCGNPEALDEPREIILEFTPSWQIILGGSSSTYVDRSHQIARDSDDNIIVAISNVEDARASCAILGKISTHGDEVWRQSFDYSELPPVPYDEPCPSYLQLVVDNEDNIITMGDVGGLVNRRPVSAVYARKHSEDGSTVWTRYHGDAIGGDVGVDQEGNVLVVGAETREAPSYIPWSQWRSHNGMRIATHLDETTAATIVAVGLDENNAAITMLEMQDTNANPEQLSLQKIDHEGQSVWEFPFPAAQKYFRAMTLDKNQVIVLLGTANEPSIKKISESGELLWEVDVTALNLTTEDGAYVTGVESRIAIDTAGAIYGLGTGLVIHCPSYEDFCDDDTSALLLRKYNADGLHQWTRLYEAPQGTGLLAHDISLSGDGDIVITWSEFTGRDSNGNKTTFLGSIRP